MKTKETVREVLNRLPDDCTMDDVLYNLYVAREVEAGVADIEAARVIDHEDAARELRRKWSIGADG